VTEPTISLAGKTALVTEAATGIGRAIAVPLADAGARVVVNHNHTPEPAGKVVAQIAAAAAPPWPSPPTSAAGRSTGRWSAGCSAGTGAGTCC
jgi:NAD(P)-dependent dehydrogenase (short-subunit alcohol dehydrogenase family)